MHILCYFFNLNVQKPFLAGGKHTNGLGLDLAIGQFVTFCVVTCECELVDGGALDVLRRLWEDHSFRR